MISHMLGRFQLLVAAFVFLVSQAQAQLFAPPVNYGVAHYPYGMFGADFDGDGDVDLATASMGTDSISMLLNNGDATFAPALAYAIGHAGYSISGADFDGDSDMDLAVGAIDNTISILLNNGDATFTAGELYELAGVAPAIFAGNLDGDTDADIAVPEGFPSDSVRILLNQGDATFTFGWTYGVPMDPFHIFGADLDLDDDIDLSVPCSSRDSISVSLNNGDATFAPPVTYATGDYPTCIFGGDFDSDTDVDLAVVDHRDDNISIHMNNGDGSFAPRVSYWAGEGPGWVFAANFDLDGDIDLAVTNYYGAPPESISVLRNNGDGTFAAPEPYEAGYAMKWLTGADLDGDSDIDLAATSLLTDDVSILINLTIVGVEEIHGVRSKKPTARLGQNWPNPFTQMTDIRYQIGHGAGTVHATLRAYDLSGRLVKTLVDEHKGPGNHWATWDGKNETGRGVSAGVYFYRLEAGDFASTKRMVLIR